MQINYLNQKGDEAINPQVSKAANNLLNDWLDQDNDILEIERKLYEKERKLQ